MITLTTRNQQRISALVALAADQVTPGEAAKGLGISIRQLRRIRSRFDADGAAGLMHRGLAKKPANACDPQLKAEVVALYREKYPDFNQEHFTEFLLQNHNINLSRS